MTELRPYVLETLNQLNHHHQDHGWRDFFEALQILLQEESPVLVRILEKLAASRPHANAPHMITVLSMATHMVVDTTGEDPRTFFHLPSARQRAHALEQLWINHETAITEVLLLRHNSFTGVRRFLVPQVLISRYFLRQQVESFNFADLGTGLGLLPRQLNSRNVYERFSSDLSWPDGIPDFLHTPIRQRFAIDCPPLPDLEWVHYCYGPSEYYDKRFQELLWTLKQPEVAQARVQMLGLDIFDSKRLATFISNNEIKAATCNFVLFQYGKSLRNQFIASVLEHMARPGLLISMEPRGDLTLPGCWVTLFCPGESRGVRFATVTDNHFVGEVLPREDYESFTEGYL